MIPLDVLIPYTQGELVALLHEHGFVEHEEHIEQGTHIVGRAPVTLAGRFSPYRKGISS
jgi:GTP-binding protein HflX